MRVAMIGTGYVGLVSGTCFSEFGHSVVCVDNDRSKIERLLGGEIPIYEPGLDDLVARNVRSGHLGFTTDLAQAVRDAEVVFIAVGTPSRRGDGHADLSYVFEAVRQVAMAADGYRLVVTKSTVPVGTGAKVKALLAETRPDLPFDVASNPEFLREGSAIEDFMRPDRVVVGTETARARELMTELYRPLFLAETPIVHTTIESAELIKYAANAFLATKITFINEVADLCEKVGANVQDIARGIGLDGRIGRKFLHAGPGFGGSCFPKDTRALVSSAQEYNAPLSLVEQVVASNEARKRRMADRVIAAAGGSLAGKTVGVLGLTFKPNTDDMREAPSLDIVPALIRAGATVRAYDPEGMAEARRLLDRVVWAEDAYDAVTGADVAVLVTEWNQFRALDLDRVKAAMKAPVMVDLRNVYKPEEMAARGFAYSSIGRPAAGLG
ncbi:UDP-glucose/GDP-mannose dehydrogenase family protein [Tistrella mobilis]|uniref:UDP-glucose 6-dehydrogenase n=1 Tax=Tistrella mobilis (strain KA081020-065) TaxID=1110502 RepID=I3TI29_TISMK|nr:UDP-glucose/GDP-mannose dehydrogenase family protein [Tistrella mobilis]AFK52417.1 putative UDP glucose dehydrogenase [Tistrella mobilis KA081020-065]MAM73731.1 UDP-glucose/GDP-mannose dehydrogenase family protein [Tistrella sp.]